MKVNIAAVGKIKEKYFIDAITEYVKRAGRFADVKITECPEYPPKTQSPAEIALSVEKEGKKLLDNFIYICYNPRVAKDSRCQKA